MTEVSFRSLLRDDLPLLFEWLCRPHVARWWTDVPADLSVVEAEYGKCIDGDDPTELFIVMLGDRPVGMIQRYLIADEIEWVPAFEGIVDVSNAAGLDYLIGEADAVGVGIGSATIAAIVPLTFASPRVDSIVVTVAQENVASCRILEKSGFRRIWSGILDSPEPEGPEHVYVLNRA